MFGRIWSKVAKKKRRVCVLRGGGEFPTPWIMPICSTAVRDVEDSQKREAGILKVAREYRHYTDVTILGFFFKLLLLLLLYFVYIHSYQYHFSLF